MLQLLATPEVVAVMTIYYCTTSVEGMIMATLDFQRIRMRGIS